MSRPVLALALGLAAGCHPCSPGAPSTASATASAAPRTATDTNTSTVAGRGPTPATPAPCAALPGETCCDGTSAEALGPEIVASECAVAVPYEGESAGGGCWRWFGTGPGARHAVVASVAAASDLPLDDLAAEWARTGTRVERRTGLLVARRTGVTGPTVALAGVVAGKTLIVEADEALCAPASAARLWAGAARRLDPAAVVPTIVF